jgi:hypothetical protein
MRSPFSVVLGNMLHAMPSSFMLEGLVSIFTCDFEYYESGAIVYFKDVKDRALSSGAHKHRKLARQVPSNRFHPQQI